MWRTISSTPDTIQSTPDTFLIEQGIICEVRTERDASIVELDCPTTSTYSCGATRNRASTGLVTQIAGRSSRLLRDEFPHLRSRPPTLWANSYFVATVGGATLEVVKRYVENQRTV